MSALLAALLAAVAMAWCPPCPSLLPVVVQAFPFGPGEIMTTSTADDLHTYVDGLVRTASLQDVSKRVGRRVVYGRFSLHVEARSPDAAALDLPDPLELAVRHAAIPDIEPGDRVRVWVADLPLFRHAPDRVEVLKLEVLQSGRTPDATP